MKSLFPIRKRRHWQLPAEAVKKLVATNAIERKAATKSIVVRFCAKLFIKESPESESENFVLSF